MRAPKGKGRPRERSPLENTHGTPPMDAPELSTLDRLVRVLRRLVRAGADIRAVHWEHLDAAPQIEIDYNLAAWRLPAERVGLSCTATTRVEVFTAAIDGIAVTYRRDARVTRPPRSSHP